MRICSALLFIPILAILGVAMPLGLELAAEGLCRRRTCLPALTCVFIVSVGSQNPDENGFLG